VVEPKYQSLILRKGIFDGTQKGGGKMLMKKIVSFTALLSVQLICLASGSIEYCPDYIYCYASDIRSCSVRGSSSAWGPAAGGVGEIDEGIYSLSDVYSYLEGKHKTDCVYEYHGTNIIVVSSRSTVKLAPYVDANSKWETNEYNDSAVCSSNNPFDCPLEDLLEMIQ